MTTANTWKARYMSEVESSIEHYTWLNSKQPVYTRQMTKEEYDEAFGAKRESCHKLKLKENNNDYESAH